MYIEEILSQIEVDWLLQQYDVVGVRKLVHLIVGAQQGTPPAEINKDLAEAPEWLRKNVTVRDFFAGIVIDAFLQVTGARLPLPYGTHHTKMTVLHYTDGIRVVIYTANLIERDWTYKTQGVLLVCCAHRSETFHCRRLLDTSAIIRL